MLREILHSLYLKRSKMPEQPYDAILILSFGGPEGMDDVIPFLENVLRGRGVPRARLEEVAEHYYHFDGVSPINAQNLALIEALEMELKSDGPDLPIYYGNRNWQPFLVDVMRQMAADGVKRALTFITGAYSSYSGCRQYRENIMDAQAQVGPTAPRVDKLRFYYNHPAFIEVNAENVRTALAQIPAERRAVATIAFTAHSIPLSMAQHCQYEAQLAETMRLVVEALDVENPYQLVYQSRSGSPHQPWLEPDILDHMDALKEAGVTDLVIAPIGFISDHMEILFDLDTEAIQKGDEIHMKVVRAATVGVDPKFIRMIRDLIVERIEAEQGMEPERVALGDRGPSHDVCPANCCLLGVTAQRPRK
jgi:protoporphyrin/coproporphyrin ferrochelatase